MALIVNILIYAVAFIAAVYGAIAAYHGFSTAYPSPKITYRQWFKNTYLGEMKGYSPEELEHIKKRDRANNHLYLCIFIIFCLVLLKVMIIS